MSQGPRKLGTGNAEARAKDGGEMLQNRTGNVTFYHGFTRPTIIVVKFWASCFTALDPKHLMNGIGFRMSDH